MTAHHCNFTLNVNSRLSAIKQSNSASVFDIKHLGSIPIILTLLHYGLTLLVVCMLWLGSISNCRAAIEFSPIFGGAGGTQFTDAVADVQVLSGIQLSTGNVVYSIQGSTLLGNLPFHGGTAGTLVSVTWPGDEYLVRMFGIYGSVIGQISFVTNTGRILGPFGSGKVTNPTNFDYTVPLGNRILGFHGRASAYLDAIGVMYDLVPNNFGAVFFKDTFERTSFNNSVGLGGLTQNNLGDSQSDVYKDTRLWNADANGMGILHNDGLYQDVFPFNAHSGKHMVQLDTGKNSGISTKVNLVNGSGYILRFFYRSQQLNTGEGMHAELSAPGFSTTIDVSDKNDWAEAIQKFSYTGPTGEVLLKITATGPENGTGVVLDDVTLETDIFSILTQPNALTGVLPPPVPGLLSSDSNRSDIVTPIVIDKQAAIVLGKALFWDQAVGSDQMACASCHYHAGTDNRFKNQVSPGLKHAASTGTTFETTASGKLSGPNHVLTRSDFPFNPLSDDTVASAGTFSGTFSGTVLSSNVDDCARSVDSIFHVKGVGVRNVEPRNTPSVINAAYNHRNFWDGRASNEFNGVSPFGARDISVGVLINKAGVLEKHALKLKNSALAAQAVGPVGSDFEMACRARQFADVGRKLLNRSPLALQSIAADDSVLSAMPRMIGAKGIYQDLIKKAFAPEYWNGVCQDQCGKPNAGVLPELSYTQMEANFSMYFGLAVQLYEETLRSDDSRFDKWKRGLITASKAELNGELIFNGKGGCNICHNGPAVTTAAVLQTDNNVIEGMLMANNRIAIYDVGFYNLGVVPSDFNLGGGGLDPFGNTLTFTRQYIQNQFVDDFGVEPCDFNFSNGLCANNSPEKRSVQSPAVDGAFKTPSLRNVELTGPYMHNGSLLNLEQVVEFYNHAGNVDNPDKFPLQVLALTKQEKADLVVYLKMFTDERVRYERAPFDHPSLTIPHGQVGNETAVTAGNPLNKQFALDEIKSISALGKNGSTKALSVFEAQLK